VNKLVEIEKGMLRSDLPSFGPGDTVKVSFHVHEGKKEKVQAFQGVCIKIHGAGPNRSFTLRKVSQGVGIERIFPLHSPMLEKIEIVRYGKVRRARLYYLRDKVGKGLMIKERIVRKDADASKKTRKKTNKPVVEVTSKEELDAQESGPPGVAEG
jgi:large subunit ribosomal protein L19